MNDTIVVFDRIRENLRLSRREPLPDLVNRSINQTLSRTVLTSGLTFLTVLSLFIFGGQVLNGFSFALVVGILIGTYSSIAVASHARCLAGVARGQREGCLAASRQTRQSVRQMSDNRRAGSRWNVPDAGAVAEGRRRVGLAGPELHQFCSTFCRGRAVLLRLFRS